MSLWRTLRGLGCVLTSSVKWRNPSVMSSGGRGVKRRIVKETIELVDQEAIRVLDEATQTVGQPKG